MSIQTRLLAEESQKKKHPRCHWKKKNVVETLNQKERQLRKYMQSSVDALSARPSDSVGRRAQDFFFAQVVA
jgi:hypothetical protein